MKNNQKSNHTLYFKILIFYFCFKAKFYTFFFIYKHLIKKYIEKILQKKKLERKIRSLLKVFVVKYS